MDKVGFSLGFFIPFFLKKKLAEEGGFQGFSTNSRYHVREIRVKGMTN